MNDKLKTLIDIDKAAENLSLIKIHRQRCWDNSVCANCEKQLKLLESQDEEYLQSALCLECQEEFLKRMMMNTIFKNFKNVVVYDYEFKIDKWKPA